ncbi:winged helix-turn-helix domain-containing tetratricopeptide repeat protein [Alterisphingorhabdus coralli]|uniref:Winged helix-turn-helix domain-containing protein n=1 Tax=Alterisphingorhabdus coralli TaxID=3071408 RepID=A0AA97F7N4_9SPHN|nr:winged helix-turn-helix domain-containing protein [Parasphingorhabdus sp. SCSIO 66989]WOE74783.1 winged helix-turn-helix domain-containing protein [Parasphingorhabdus sp. SCSIO 66989]
MLYRFDGYSLDSDRFILTDEAGETIPLEPRALELLLLLVRHAGKMVSKETIFQEIWGRLHVSRSVLPFQVSAIRKALCDTQKPYRTVETVHGKGLRFLVQVQQFEDPDRPIPHAAIVAADISAPAGERDQLQSSLIGKRPGIAVLPFTQRKEEDAPPGLGSAIAVDVITALSRQTSLRVTARGSSFLLDGPNVSPLAVRSALGTDYSLSGQISSAGEKLHIYSELADTHGQHIVWADTFEIDLRGVHQTRDMIAGQIVDHIQSEVSRAEAKRVRLHQPESLTAWQAFHVGDALLFRRGQDNILRARTYFERSVAIDPDFAHAWAGLAHTYAFELIHKPFGDNRLANRMLMQCAEKAMRADPHDPAAHMTMGRAVGMSDSRESPEPWLDTAVKLAPSYAFAHQQLGLFLSTGDNREKATEHSNASILLSPLGPERFSSYANLAVIHFRSGDVPTAIEWGRKAGLVPYDDAYALVTGLCANHLGGDQEAAAGIANRFKRAFPNMQQRDILSIYDDEDDMRTAIGAIYSAYGID